MRKRSLSLFNITDVLFHVYPHAIALNVVRMMARMGRRMTVRERRRRFRRRRRRRRRRRSVANQLRISPHRSVIQCDCAVMTAHIFVKCASMAKCARPLLVESTSCWRARARSRRVRLKAKVMIVSTGLYHVCAHHHARRRSGICACS